MGQELSGRFELYMPPGYQDQKPKILLVGKATDGDYDHDEVASVHQDKKTAFWRFADRVSLIADETCRIRSNVAWTNIFKQGSTKGNPTGDLAREKSAEAIELLKEDVAKSKPDLIVLVTAGFYEEIPKQALEILDGDSALPDDGKLIREPSGDKRYTIWSRGKHKDLPAIVWLNHPQFKSIDYLEDALSAVHSALKRV